MLVDEDRLHHLKQDAKWGSSIENQISAVKELGTFGAAAIPSLQEILQISVRDEIKQCCEEAIRELGRTIGSESVQAKKTRRARKTRRKSRVSAR